tara:strand:+ start:265 stop:396 length:132 start_codon:yes stop_codon:yes gene_type:complete
MVLAVLVLLVRVMLVVARHLHQHFLTEVVVEAVEAQLVELQLI